ncbi:hypothetical protein C8R43DRAFT_963028 [Mycena crocata]|nr:hypothetical protein C8R43DRAFT_963028 [Mycena crocata]
MRGSLPSLVALASYVSPFSGVTCRITYASGWCVSYITQPSECLELILPSMASITFGVQSSDVNGCRDDLYNLLANDGNTVNMVGTQRGGDSKDPDNEGWPGFVVSERADAGRSVPLVDSHAVTAVGDLIDGTHPNDAGYERIGRVFYDGIVRAKALGWLFPVDGPAP